MADWEEFVVAELDSDFIMTKMSIVVLGHISSKLRHGGKQCNALADKCDVLANRIARKATRGRHART